MTAVDNIAEIARGARELRVRVENGTITLHAAEGEDCVEAAMKLANKLAVMPTAGLVATRKLLRAAASNDLDEQLDLERDTQSALGRTHDYIEGDDETGAVGAIANAHGVPFIGFRGISDGSPDPLMLSGYAQFAVYDQLAADNAAELTLAFVAAWN